MNVAAETSTKCLTLPFTCLVFKTGTPLAILNRAITVGTVSNVRGDCNAIGTSSFNPNSGIMQVCFHE